MLRYYVLLIGPNQLPLQNDLRWLLRRGSPLPIPNRVVKPACADGTAICGRVCRRLSLWNPSFFKLGFFFLWVRRVRPLGSVRRLSLEKPVVKTTGFLF
jgi:hypothetical protein